MKTGIFYTFTGNVSIYDYMIIHVGSRIQKHNGASFFYFRYAIKLFKHMVA